MDSSNPIDTSKVTALIDKAAAAGSAVDALQFSQAALNAAHALQVMKTELLPKQPTP